MVLLADDRLTLKPGDNLATVDDQRGVQRPDELRHDGLTVAARSLARRSMSPMLPR